jgi:hypothetical protein
MNILKPSSFGVPRSPRSPSEIGEGNKLAIYFENHLILNVGEITSVVKDMHFNIHDTSEDTETVEKRCDLFVYDKLQQISESSTGTMQLLSEFLFDVLQQDTLSVTYMYKLLRNEQTAAIFTQRVSEYATTASKTAEEMFDLPFFEGDFQKICKSRYLSFINIFIAKFLRKVARVRMSESEKKYFSKIINTKFS